MGNGSSDLAPPSPRPGPSTGTVARAPKTPMRAPPTSMSILVIQSPHDSNFETVYVPRMRQRIAGKFGAPGEIIMQEIYNANMVYRVSDKGTNRWPGSPINLQSPNIDNYEVLCSKLNV